MASTSIKPHGFDEKEHPWIKLIPLDGGAAQAESLKELVSTGKKIIDMLQQNTKTSTGGKKFLTQILLDMNKYYYGSNPGTPIVIPITESFKMNADNEFETIDPMSTFSGAVGAGMLVGANILGINGLIGKVWAGSNIGIGNFQFSVAVDTSTTITDINNAVEQNKNYVNALKSLAFVSRPEKQVGVLSPPKFCKLTSSWGDFSRMYVGIKSMDIETIGMWNSSENPIAYNITIEVEDMVLGLKPQG